MLDNNLFESKIEQNTLIEWKQLIPTTSETNETPALGQIFDQLGNCSKAEAHRPMSHLVLRPNAFESQSIMGIRNRSKKSYGVLSNSFSGAEEANTFHVILTRLPHSRRKSAWQILESFIGTVEAPSDWSINHDHYLYGRAKE